MRRVFIVHRYNEAARIAGILYLHDISQKRSSKWHRAIVNELCGMCKAQNIVLLMTMWDDIQNTMGERREGELRDDFWAEMGGRGARMERFHLDVISAQAVINSLAV
jgi:hypothetical protein